MTSRQARWAQRDGSRPSRPFYTTTLTGRARARSALEPELAEARDQVGDPSPVLHLAAHHGELRSVVQVDVGDVVHDEPLGLVVERLATLRLVDRRGPVEQLVHARVHVAGGVLEP